MRPSPLQIRTRTRNLKIYRLRGLIAGVSLLVTNQPRRATIISWLLDEIDYLKQEQKKDG